MEAYGIDVFATARANGFPIEVVRDEEDEQHHNGLVLIDRPFVAVFSVLWEYTNQMKIRKLIVFALLGIPKGVGEAGSPRVQRQQINGHCIEP